LMKSFVLTALAASFTAAQNALTDDQHYSQLSVDYYEGSWDSLPYFANLTPVLSSYVDNINF